jgi:hypothetical protein
VTKYLFVNSDEDYMQGDTREILREIPDKHSQTSVTKYLFVSKYSHHTEDFSEKEKVGAHSFPKFIQQQLCVIWRVPDF